LTKRPQADPLFQMVKQRQRSDGSGSAIFYWSGFVYQVSLQELGNCSIVSKIE